MLSTTIATDITSKAEVTPAVLGIIADPITLASTPMVHLAILGPWVLVYTSTSTTTQLIQHQQLQVALRPRMTVCKVIWDLTPEASSTVCMGQSCTYTSIILQRLRASMAEPVMMDMD